jgi:hypothetical protein
MRNDILMSIGPVAAVLLLSAASVKAQEFAIEWWTVDCGGEVATSGGAWEVSGSVGQHDAGAPAAGGSFEVAAGFWPGATAPCAVSVPQPVFLAIGDLPGGIYSSRVNTISSDGTTVTGYSESAIGREAFRWTELTGIVGLGDLAGCGGNSNGIYVSADGASIGGWGQSTASCCGGCPGTDGVDKEATRWAEADGHVPLGDLAGGVYWSRIGGGSENGGMLVGWSHGTVGGSTSLHGFYWTEAAGLQPLISATTSTAEALCGDGPVIVGSAIATTTGGAAYWPSAASAPVIVGDLPGGVTSAAFRSCSHDASVMVGTGTATAGREAMYWTSPSGLVSLGDLPGGVHESHADGVSPDGLMIVGYGYSASGQEALVWDETRTMHRASDFLAANGVVVPAGWTLRQARDVAVNGHVVTLAGVATNAGGSFEGWVARYPRGGVVLDCNDNGLLDGCELAGNDLNGNNVPDDCDQGACCTAGSCVEMPLSECGPFVCDVAEHMPATFAGCFGDGDGNGVVNAADRGFISANVGETGHDLVCKFDMDGNGVINAADRGFVSANIGLCSPLPDWQNGSGLNHGVPDTRFGTAQFMGVGTTCASVVCP